MISDVRTVRRIFLKFSLAAWAAIRGNADCPIACPEQCNRQADQEPRVRNGWQSAVYRSPEANSGAEDKTRISDTHGEPFGISSRTISRRRASA